MAITAQNLSYFGSAPVAGGSTVLGGNFSGSQLFTYVAKATITGDNSTTTANVNWLDGSNALGFTPTAVQVIRYGGNAANSIVMYADTENVTNILCPIIFSAAPGLNATVKVLVLAFK